VALPLAREHDTIRWPGIDRSLAEETDGARK
jgi:hypothetical protein